MSAGGYMFLKYCEKGQLRVRGTFAALAQCNRTAFTTANSQLPHSIFTPSSSSLRSRCTEGLPALRENSASMLIPFPTPKLAHAGRAATAYAWCAARRFWLHDSFFMSIRSWSRPGQVKGTGIGRGPCSE
eukprot:3808510-Pleurochrysis_carterae.AAC.2